MPISIAGKEASSQRGFSYIMVLAAVVIVGILVEVARVTTWRVIRTDKETELLYRGAAYRSAIESFYKSNGRFPSALEDLVKDPRSASRRHLRRLYPDPMSNVENKEWTLIRSKDGGIAGVASGSKDEPMKQANFPKQFEKFASAKTYSDWVFEYVPPAVAGQQTGSTTSPPVGPPVLRTF